MLSFSYAIAAILAKAIAGLKFLYGAAKLLSCNPRAQPGATSGLLREGAGVRQAKVAVLEVDMAVVEVGKDEALASRQPMRLTTLMRSGCQTSCLRSRSVKMVRRRRPSSW